LTIRRAGYILKVIKSEKEYYMFTISDKASEMLKEYFTENKAAKPSIRVIMNEGG
jgi:hypothetical protein